MKITKSASGVLTFGGDSYHSLVRVPGARQARKVAAATAIQIADPFKFVNDDGSVQEGAAGDWLLQSGEDVYIVKDSMFRQLYELMPEP